jgi:hypothetical protein
MMPVLTDDATSYNRINEVKAGQGQAREFSGVILFFLEVEINLVDKS